jgi:prepilin signal peptidase PulO-like enzyme (type II secretory pathway)
MWGWVAALSVVTAGLLEGTAAYAWAARWAERGIALRADARWRAARASAAVIGGVVFAAVTGSAPAAVAGAAVCWLAVTATMTDLDSRKVPREACWTVLAVGTVVGAVTGSVAGAASAGVALLALGGGSFLVALLTRGGLGSGDVRLLAALSVLAWWSGPMVLLIGVAVAGALQAVLRAGAALAHRPDARAWPFAPALSAGVLAAGFAGAASAGVCSDWAGLLPC